MIKKLKCSSDIITFFIDKIKKYKLLYKKRLHNLIFKLNYYIIETLGYDQFAYINSNYGRVYLVKKNYCHCNYWRIDF